MTRQQIVFNEVEKAYAQDSVREMGAWMWHNHVQWVANKGRELAEKYDADTEKVYCAALLHDIADSTLEREDDTFDTWSEQKGREILESAQFTQDEIAELLEIIIRPHSCRPNNLPTTLEGKVLATADAMFHLQTSFFPMLCFKNKPPCNSYHTWQEWFSEKIERDFGPKIFFAEERELVRADCEALKRVFPNQALTD